MASAHLYSLQISQSHIMLMLINWSHYSLLLCTYFVSEKKKKSIQNSLFFSSSVCYPLNDRKKPGTLTTIHFRPLKDSPTYYDGSVCVLVLLVFFRTLFIQPVPVMPTLHPNLNWLLNTTITLPLVFLTEQTHTHIQLLCIFTHTN